MVYGGKILLFQKMIQILRESLRQNATSIRVAKNLNLSSTLWRNLMQMKIAVVILFLIENIYVISNNEMIRILF